LRSGSALFIQELAALSPQGFHEKFTLKPLRIKREQLHFL